MSAMFETILAAEESSLGWLAITILVLLAILSRKPPRRGKRTTD